MIKTNKSLTEFDNAFFVEKINSIESSKKLIKSLQKVSALELSSRQLLSILTDAIAASGNNDPFVSLTGYKEGKLVANDPEVSKAILSVLQEGDSLEGLRGVNYSIKVTSLQSIDQNLKDFCRSLSQALNWEYCLNINMYITPGLDKNCFEFHSDPYVSMIYQIQGRKKWFFPVNEKHHVCNYNPAEPLPEFDSTQVITEIINPSEWIFIPVGAIHRAGAIDDEISIHLTFSLHTNKTYNGLADILKNTINDVLKIRTNKYNVISNEEYAEILNHLKEKIDENLNREKIFELNKAQNMNAFKKGHPMNRKI